MWGSATAELKNNVLDTAKEETGLQLPPKFEDKFTSIENKKKLVAAVKEGLDSLGNDKDVIKNKVSEEIKTWETMPTTADTNYSAKIAVLYFYAALTDPNNKNPDIGAVEKTYNAVKNEKNIVEKAKTEVMEWTGGNWEKHNMFTENIQPTNEIINWPVNVQKKEAERKSYSTLGTFNAKGGLEEAKLKPTEKEIKKNTIIQKLNLIPLADWGYTRMKEDGVNYYAWSYSFDDNNVLFYTNEFTGKQKYNEATGEWTFEEVMKPGTVIESIDKPWTYAYFLTHDRNGHLLWVSGDEEKQKTLIDESVNELFRWIKSDDKYRDDKVDLLQNNQIRTIKSITDESITLTINKKNPKDTNTKEWDIKFTRKFDKGGIYNGIDIQRDEKKSEPVKENNKVESNQLANVATEATRLAKDSKEVTSVLNAYTWDDAQEIKEYNLNNSDSKFVDIVNFVSLKYKSNPNDEGPQTSMKFLTDGDLKGFQTSIGITDTKVNGNFWPETFDVAKEKLSWDKNYDLDWLTKIDKNIAEKLIQFTGNLSLDWLTKIDKDTAQELAKFPGWRLSLDWITTIDDKKTVQELATFKGFLSLDWLKTIDENTVNLAKFEGEALSLNWIEKGDEKFLKNLVTNKNLTQLYVNWLKNITEDMAKSLAKNNWSILSLNLNWVIDINKKAAQELAKFKGDYLNLDWVTKIDKETVQELVTFQGKRLSLDWVLDMNKDIAQELAKFPGDLSLNWLTKLDKDTTQELAKKGKTWYLSLDWLTSIDEKTVQELAKFQGKSLYLDLLQTMGDYNVSTLDYDQKIATIQAIALNNPETDTTTINNIKWTIASNLDNYLQEYWASASFDKSQDNSAKIVKTGTDGNKLTAFIDKFMANMRIQQPKDLQSVVVFPHDINVSDVNDVNNIPIIAHNGDVVEYESNWSASWKIINIRENGYVSIKRSDDSTISLPADRIMKIVSENFVDKNNNKENKDISSTIEIDGVELEKTSDGAYKYGSAEITVDTWVNLYTTWIKIWNIFYKWAYEKSEFGMLFTEDKTTEAKDIFNFIQEKQKLSV